MPSLPEIPGYEIERELGGGYSGMVYRARRTSDGFWVALKVFADEGLDVRRFAREGKLLERSPHPFLVPLVESGLEADPPYLAFRLLTGGDLAKVSGRGLPPERVVLAGIRVAEALAHLHGHGILHRDVKPQNIFLDGSGRAILGDLGLGRVEGGTRLTATGSFVGTPGFIAPEVTIGAPAQAASDLYALGVTLAAVATGTRPAEGLGDEPFAEEVVDGIQPPALAALLRFCLRAAPEDRPPSAAAVRDQLREIAKREGYDLREATPPRQPGAGGPELPMLLAGGAAVLLLLGTFLLPGSPAPTPAGPGAASAPPPTQVVREDRTYRTLLRPASMGGGSQQELVLEAVGNPGGERLWERVLETSRAPGPIQEFQVLADRCRVVLGGSRPRAVEVSLDGRLR